MNLTTKIVGQVKYYILHLQYSVMNHIKNTQAPWTMSDVLYTLRKTIHFLILLTLLGLTIYLLPVDP